MGILRKIAADRRSSAACLKFFYVSSLFAWLDFAFFDILFFLIIVKFIIHQRIDKSTYNTTLEVHGFPKVGQVSGKAGPGGQHRNVWQRGDSGVQIWQAGQAGCY
jgi:hypothetical protein